MADGSKNSVPIICRIDTVDEVEYFKNGGILQYVLRNLLRDAGSGAKQARGRPST